MHQWIWWNASKFIIFWTMLILFFIIVKLDRKILTFPDFMFNFPDFLNIAHFSWPWTPKSWLYLTFADRGYPAEAEPERTCLGPVCNTILCTQWQEQNRGVTDLRTPASRPLMGAQHVRIVGLVPAGTPSSPLTWSNTSKFLLRMRRMWRGHPRRGN